MARVIGLDLSIAATGVAHTSGHLETWKLQGGDDRLVGLAANLIATLLADHVDLIVIEDMLFTPRAAKSTGITSMVHGVVRVELLRRNVPYLLVPPATVKTYATGKGNATKPDMRVELLKRTQLDVRDDNQVDAWWLRALGRDLLGEPLLELPQTHRRALSKLTVPVAA